MKEIQLKNPKGEEASGWVQRVVDSVIPLKVAELRVKKQKVKEM